MSINEDKIIAALNRMDDGQDVDTLPGVLTDMLSKQSLFLRVYPFVGTLVFLGLGIFAAVRFFTAQQTQEWIAYATLFLTAVLAITMIKLWYFMVWVRNSLMREIKRAELRTMKTNQA